MNLFGSFLPRAFSFVLGLACAGVACAADAVPGLLKLLPTNVNSISVIRVDELMKSERAVAEKWKDSQAADFLAGAGRIPPWVSTLVRGTEVRSFSVGPTFSLSLAPKPAEMSLEKLLPKDKIDYDQIGQTMAWRSPRGYMAEAVPGVVALMGPPNRQSFAYWLRTIAAAKEPTYSPYLQSVTEKFEPQILYAMDLADFFDPDLIANRVTQSQALVGKSAEAKALTELMFNLRGARVGVNVAKDITLAIAFDFNGQVGPEGQYLKPLLIEILDDAGARIDELDSAKVKIGPHTVELLMPLTDPGLRRIMTLILTPISVESRHYAPAAGTTRTPPPATSSQVMGETTKKYFDLVNNTMKDLQILNRRAKEYDRTAQWHDTYARKINDFPTAGVDPEVVSYASWLADDLRALAASLRGEQVTTQRLGEQVSYKWNISNWYGPAGTWTGFGYQPAPWEINSNIQEVRQAQQEAINKGSDQRDQIWSTMLAEKDKVAAAMSKKYGISFEQKSS